MDSHGDSVSDLLGALEGHVSRKPDGKIGEIAVAGTDIAGGIESLSVPVVDQDAVLEQADQIVADVELAQQVALREPEGMLHALKRLGIQPEEVDAVVTTHLHWDHAGGLTRRDENGEVELTFKKARHFIQRSEWDFALQPDVRSRASYITDDFTPLADGNDLVEFLDGDAEVLPGVQIRHVGGHTPGSQVLILRSGELACAVTGDLVCQTPHLRVPWNMAADIEPLRVFEQKAKLLDEAERHRWLLVLSHEPDMPAGYLEEGGRWRPEPRLA